MGEAAAELGEAEAIALRHAQAKHVGNISDVYARVDVKANLQQGEGGGGMRVAGAHGRGGGGGTISANLRAETTTEERAAAASTQMLSQLFQNSWPTGELKTGSRVESCSSDEWSGLPSASEIIDIFWCGGGSSGMRKRNRLMNVASQGGKQGLPVCSPVLYR